MIRIDGKEVVRIVDRLRDTIRIEKNGVVLWEGNASCFATGFWQDMKPWTDEKAWKD